MYMYVFTSAVKALLNDAYAMLKLKIYLKAIAQAPRSHK